MPKKIYRLKNFHKGINSKYQSAVDNVSQADDMDTKGVFTQLNNVMVDSVGQIRPAGFWEQLTSSPSNNFYDEYTANLSGLVSGIAGNIECLDVIYTSNGERVIYIDSTNNRLYIDSNYISASSGIRLSTTSINDNFWIFTDQARYYYDESSSSIGSIDLTKQTTDTSVNLDDSSMSYISGLSKSSTKLLGKTPTINSGDYELGWSYVFTNDMEGVIQQNSSLEQVKVDNVTAGNDNLVLNFYPNVTLPSNVKALRWYVKKQDGIDWHYIGTWTPDDTFRGKWLDTTDSMINNIGDNDERFWISTLSPITYEAVNGYTADIDSITLNSAQDVCQLNNRTFAIKGKKIHYSIPGKPIIFPYNDDGSGNVLNPVNAEGNGIAIESVNNTLLYFTDQKILIISAQGQPANWKTIETFNMGVNNKNQVVKTDSGVAWINEYGAYYFDQKGMKKLTQKISSDDWKDDFYSINSEIVYNPSDKQFLFFNNTANEVAIYDIKTQSYVNKIVSRNSTSINQGKEIYGRSIISAGDNNLYKWSNSPYINSNDGLEKGNSGIEIITKDIYIKVPRYNKKIYTLFLLVDNYYTDDITVNITELNNSNSYSTTITGKSSVGDEPLEQKVAIDLGKIEDNSFKFKFTYSGFIVIKDIAIEYRLLRGKTV